MTSPLNPRPVGTRPLAVAQGDWWRKGACKDENPNLFFSRYGEHADEHAIRVREAQKVCDPCPVKDACRAWGETHEHHGVWGSIDLDHVTNVKRRQKPVRVPQEARCERCGDIYVPVKGPKVPLCRACACDVATSPSRAPKGERPNLYIVE